MAHILANWASCSSISLQEDYICLCRSQAMQPWHKFYMDMIVKSKRAVKF